jgi:hypothetical protein
MRLLTTREDHIGWAHPNALKGDGIYLLFGIKVLTVLRPHMDGFKGAGDAYVEGIMNGKLVEKFSGEAQDCKSAVDEKRVVEVCIY